MNTGIAPGRDAFTEEKAMKKALVRFFVVALECAMGVLPYLAAWVIWRLRQ